jgi:hypothetical protein
MKLRASSGMISLGYMNNHGNKDHRRVHKGILERGGLEQFGINGNEELVEVFISRV